MRGRSGVGAQWCDRAVTGTWSDVELTDLENGRRLVGGLREGASRRTISVSTALVSCLNGVSALGDVCSRMDAIQPGYAVTPALSGSMTLTPVWRVTTDTGAYQLDTVTGPVARLGCQASFDVPGHSMSRAPHGRRGLFSRAGSSHTSGRS